MHACPYYICFNLVFFFSLFALSFFQGVIRFYYMFHEIPIVGPNFLSFHEINERFKLAI